MNMDPAALLAYTVAAVALILTPGPDTAFVLARSVAAGPSTGVRAALGVATGVLVHTVGAVAGLSALFRVSPAAYDAVRVAGAAYLLYLGVATLRGGGLALDAGGEGEDRGGGGFRQGLATNVLNPKVALFFLAFLPQFGAGLELLPLGGLYAALTATYLGGVALVSGRAQTAVERPGVRRTLRGVSASVLLVLGGTLLLGLQ